MTLKQLAHFTKFEKFPLTEYDQTPIKQNTKEHSNALLQQHRWHCTFSSLLFMLNSFYIQIYIYMCVCVCIYMYISVYIYNIYIYIYIYQHVIDSYRYRFLQIVFIISISQYPRCCNSERRVRVKCIDVEMTWLTLEIGTGNLDTTCVHPPHTYQ